MTGGLRAAAALGAATLLLGCGGTSFFNPEPEPQITIRSASNGQTVLPTDTIVFGVAGGTMPAIERVTVDVSTFDGTAAGGTVIDNPTPGTDLSLDLTSLAGRPGQYRARFVLHADGAVLDEKTLVFFVTDSRIVVNGIESRPSIISPGASVELSVGLDMRQGTDPFVRWTQNGRPFGGGLASAGATAVSWKAPRDPGVYTIGVEVFPAPPADGTRFAYPSSLRTSTELYVSESRRGRGMGPVSSYWMLYDLDGTLRDATRPALEAYAVGTIEPVASGEYLGYRMSSPSGLRIARTVVPEGDEAAAAFTISVALTPAEARPGARILHSGGERRSLTIALGAEGSPQAVFRSEDGEIVVRSGLPPLVAGTRSRLDFTYERTATSAVAMWFLDGEPGAVSVLKQVPALPIDGETLIGGLGGLSAIVDELGVHLGPDPGVYARALADRYGNALLLADGFDGGSLDKRYVVSGTATVALGRLVLAPGASVQVALQTPVDGDVVLETVADHELLPKWEGRTLRMVAGAARSAEERIRVRIRPEAGGSAGRAGYQLALDNPGTGTVSVASLLGYLD